MIAIAVAVIVADLVGLAVVRVIVRRRRDRRDADRFSRRELVRRGWGDR